MNLFFYPMLISAALLTAAGPAWAQQPATVPSAPATPAPPTADIIVKRSGEDVAVQIVEVTPELVKYRRMDNLQGPLYSIYRTELFMIRYANGTKDVFNAARPVSAPVATDHPIPPAPAPRARTTDDSVFAHVAAGGPRLGVTVVGRGELRDRLRDDYDAPSVISQLGWQFEQRLFALPHGPMAVIEFVPLVGGLEQGLFLPSVSGILGIRGRTGLEVGLGPNLSAAGPGLVLAAGHTAQARFVNVPLNFAVVPSKEGTRFSFLMGFTYRTQPH